MQAVVVNGAEIPPQAIAAEMQHHPAPSQERAWAEAATALVVRELLLQEASRLGVTADAEANVEIGAEEALVQALLAQEVATPEPDEATCRRYWSANPEKFRAPDVYDAAHILFPASIAAPLVAQHLAAHSWRRAVSQYLRVLAVRARIEGLAIASAATALVQ